MREAITIDGEVLKIPTGVHIDGMVYYNKKVAEEAGVDPTEWTSLEEMWADQKKVKDAGETFIAMGGNTFQAGYTFHALLAAVAGPEVYDRFYGHPGRDACSTSGRAGHDRGLPQDHGADRRGVGQPGVERHHEHRDRRDALMQIHGDWMKGQWRANGKELGSGLRLRQHPGHQGAVGDGRLASASSAASTRRR